MNKVQVIIIAFSIIIVIAAIIIFSFMSSGEPPRIGDGTSQLVVWGVDRKEIFQSLFETYEREFKVKIEYEVKNPRTFRQDIIEALASEKNPDLVIATGDLVSNCKGKSDTSANLPTHYGGLETDFMLVTDENVSVDTVELFNQSRIIGGFLFTAFYVPDKGTSKDVNYFARLTAWDTKTSINNDVITGQEIIPFHVIEPPVTTWVGAGGGAQSEEAVTALLGHSIEEELGLTSGELVPQATFLSSIQLPFTGTGFFIDGKPLGLIIGFFLLILSAFLFRRYRNVSVAVLLFGLVLISLSVV